jgi:hypothetical protein
MKRIWMAIVLTMASIPAFAGPHTDVGVSVNIGQPGFYGRIDVGNMPPPPVAVIYPQPVVVVPGPVVVERRPIYLRVPPGHQKNWRRYCGQYAACGQPVYFVRDDYYQAHYYKKPKKHRHHHHRGDRDDDDDD